MIEQGDTEAQKRSVRSLLAADAAYIANAAQQSVSPSKDVDSASSSDDHDDASEESHQYGSSAYPVVRWKGEELSLCFPTFFYHVRQW